VLSSVLKRFVGYVTVEEIGDQIHVEGLNNQRLSQLIYKTWKTSKIESGIFREHNKFGFKLHKFFAVELLYIVEKLFLQYKGTQGFAKTLLSIKAGLLEHTWLKNTLVEPESPLLDRSQFKLLKKKPYPHQEAFFKEYERNAQQYGLRGYMLASPPGSGKTLMSAWLSYGLKTDHTIVVCPKNALTDPWASTLDKEFVSPPTYWTSAVGTPPPPNKRFYILHYEYLVKFLEEAKFLKGKRVNLVLDECHNFNDPDSIRTDAFVTLAKLLNPVSTLWMSGTPIKALGKEVIPFLRTIDPLFTQETETAFRTIYGLDSARALDILANRIGKTTYRIDKSQIIERAPIVKEIRVKIPKAERYTLDVIRVAMTEYITERLKYYQKDFDHYVKLFEECIRYHKDRIALKSQSQQHEFSKYLTLLRIIRKSTDYRHLGPEIKFCNLYEKHELIPSLPDALARQFKEVKSIVKYLPLKVRGECLGNLLNRKRVECAIEVMENLDLKDLVDSSIKKTLLFTSYVDVVKATDTRLKGLGYKPLTVFAETNKDLDGILERYKKGSENPLVATLDSLSTAVPILAANTVVFLNSPFRPHEREQAIARADRIGQDQQVYVFDVFLDTGNVPNISTRSKEILEWAQGQIDQLMGTTGTVSTEDYGLDTGVRMPVSFYW